MRQPIALSGLFFMFLAVMTLAGMVPVIGLALALALLPACTLGLMAASKEAMTGKFPMPTVFLSAFRAGRQQLRAMLVLGLLYGVGFWVVMGITALFDGGTFASHYMAGRMPTLEMTQQPGTQVAMLVFMGLQLLLSLMFWHAPALVHWHQVPPIKSVFAQFLGIYPVRPGLDGNTRGGRSADHHHRQPFRQPADGRRDFATGLDADRGDVFHVHLFQLSRLF